MVGEYYPYTLTDSVTLTGSTSGTIVLTIGATEEFRGRAIYFQSTGAFSITKIYDSSGKPYTNADSTNIIPSTLFLTTLDQAGFVGEFYTELQLVPNTTLYIDVLDTSTASNTIRAFIVGKKKVL